MKQTKRMNSHVGSPEFYKPPKPFSTETGIRSQYETLRECSKDLIVSFEEAIKKYESTPSSLFEKDYCSDFKTSKEILDVTTRYSVQFSMLSCQLEKWSAQRRRLIRRIESVTKSLSQTKSYCAKGRMIFSAIDISGTLGSFILDNLNVGWSPKLLFASAAFGCLSLVFSLIEITKTKSLLEEAVKEIKEDKESLRTLEVLFRKLRDFDRSVQDLFPHGVDAGIVHMLQEPNNKGSPETTKGMEGLIHTLPSSSSLNKRIWMSVLLTNAVKDINILEDEDFLAKADKFSKSHVAEIWWTRMKCKEFPSSSKSELEAELKSCMKVDLMPLHAAPFLSTPLWYANDMHTVGSVIVNSLVVFDAYYELTGGHSTKEMDVLKQLKQVFQKESDDIVNLYEKLSPHYD